MTKNVMQGKDEGADSSGNDEEDTGSRRISSGIAGKERKPLPVRSGMFLETVSKAHQKTLQVLQEIGF
ncbi:hypothetical protein HHK36_022192 [Tetracentron sinense]|uniref:Uncharacterized protein n=1 Tax=Tetracentron sinense TaxID=13715 RepID=A0A834YMI5_TETSI|nr:hypothetical protein HHK36_022192 [Tetracentron sinense]